MKKKQRLFEVMKKVNPDFKSKLNENFNDVGFKRMKIYLINNKEGDYLGDLDPINDEIAMHIDTIDDVVATPEFQKFAREKNIAKEQVGRVRTETIFSMNGNLLDKEYYSPSQSEELFDTKTNTWYNLSGQQMRDPDEYNQDSEGYTPFGDEDY